MAVSSHIYTQLLGRVAATAAGFYNIAFPQPGYHTIVRDLVVSNLHTADARFAIYWTYLGVATDLYRSIVPADRSVHQDIRQVCSPGSVIMMYTNSTNFSVVCTGYVFSTGPGVALLPVPPQPGDANVASGNT